MELKEADLREQHLREVLLQAETAKSTLVYLRPWLENHKDRILKDFESCRAEEIVKLQGQLHFLMLMERKLNTDIQSGEIAHNELLESFDSK